MKITTAWLWDDGMDGPELIAAYDELTEDAWQGTPAFFTAEVDKYDAPVRIAHIEVPSDLIYSMFGNLTVEGTVIGSSADG